MKRFFIITVLLLSAVILSACTLSAPQGDNVVNVYSERHYDTDQALFDAFTALTGIAVNVIKADADTLINRLSTEGEDTLADVLIIADAGRLHRAKSLDLLQPVTSETLEANIPSNYRDIDNHWHGLTLRARVFVYHKDRVNPNELSTYEALTEPQWNGRIVTRTSTNIYNQSLMASMIEIMGEEAATTWATGLVNNFARDPQGNDRDQAKAVASGVADVAIMNTYYIGRMMFSSDASEVEVANQVGIFFPNQETTGTHINVSGAGVTRHAKYKDNAIRFIEFLSSETAQRDFADANFEYPVNPSVEPSDTLKAWGTFKAQDINLSALGIHSHKAFEIQTLIGWK